MMSIIVMISVTPKKLVLLIVRQNKNLNLALDMVHDRCFKRKNNHKSNVKEKQQNE